MLHNSEKEVKDRDNILKNDSVRKEVVREQPEFSTLQCNVPQLYRIEVFTISSLNYFLKSNCHYPQEENIFTPYLGWLVLNVILCKMKFVDKVKDKETQFPYVSTRFLSGPGLLNVIMILECPKKYTWRMKEIEQPFNLIPHD